MLVQPDPPQLMPDLEQLREVISATEERARLLRLLLRAATRLRLHLTTGEALTAPTPATTAKGVPHG